MRRVRGNSGIGVVAGGVLAGVWDLGAAAGRRRPFVPVPLLTQDCGSFYKTRLRLPLFASPVQQLCRVHHDSRPRFPPSARPLPIQPIQTLPSTSLPLARRHQHRLLSSSTAVMSELKWPSARVRQAFFDYMEQRGHTIGMDISTCMHDLLLASRGNLYSRE